VSRVLASAAGPGDGVRGLRRAPIDGDFAPYLFRTDDFGRSWTPLHGGLPSGSVNVVVEHERNPNLLFVGTEHALWVSGDAGGSWAGAGAADHALRRPRHPPRRRTTW
jgi:hypothetical protein